MASAMEQDGSEDVNDFLKRIRELGDKRDREDEERTKRLEEEILQGRRERQARRAERARSLSPTKDSPSNTPQSTRSIGGDAPVQNTTASPPSNAPSFSPPPSRDSARSETLGRLNGDMTLMQENIDPRKTFASGSASEPSKALAGSPQASPSSAVAPSRSLTLSWQRRPTSPASNSPRSRPLSAVATENTANKSPRLGSRLGASGEVELSRSQISQSLGSKDPSWFRQTPDRGTGSAAYRRGTDDPAPADVFTGGSMRLPGMSKESTAESERQSSPPSERFRSMSPSQRGSLRGSSGTPKPLSSRDISFSASNSFEGRSPFPTASSHVLDPTPSDTTSSAGPDSQDRSSSERAMAMSPSQGRISPERMDRPPSPTKGLGGFVQSAMLKRSDSMNKRWSTQPSTGLSRGGSVASNHNAYGAAAPGLGGFAAPLSPSKLEARPSSLSRETSPKPQSRPTSSHNNAAAFQEGRLGPSSSLDNVREDDQMPARSLNRSESHDSAAPGYFDLTEPTPKTESTPSSPTKGMGHRRWSPSKSSWLETALNKGPETPKAKPSAPQQPSWMADLNKAKKDRASVDLSRSGGFKSVETGGLMRAPAMGGSTKPTVGTLSRASKSDSSNLSRPGSEEIEMEKAPLASPPTRPKSTSLRSQFSDEGRKTSLEARKSPANSTQHEVKATSSPLEESASASNASPRKSDAGHKVRSPPALKQKPETPPKKDFRSNLKPRNVAGAGKQEEEPEFKNVFGNLRRTQTKNYIAPDELKGNILRGKAGLASTGGPVRGERKDELKASLLKQKEVMKTKAVEKPDPGMNRSTSGSETFKSPHQSTPEAISRHKTLSKSAGRSPNGNVGSSSNVPVEKPAPSEAQPAPSSAKTESHVSGRLQRGDPPTTGGLAGRFNPGLAAVLAKGPRSNGAASRKVEASNDGPSLERSPSLPDESSSGTASRGNLTHATKSRARGPKRRLPASKQMEPVEIESDSRETPPTRKTEASKSPDEVRSPMSAGLRSPQSGSFKSSPKPETPPKKPGIVSTPRTTSISQPPSGKEPEVISPGLPKKRRTSSAKQSESPPSSNTEAVESAKDHADEESNVSVRNASANWGQSSRPSGLASERARSPIKLPTRKDEEAAMVDAGLRSKPQDAPEPVGLGLQSVRTAPKVQSPLDKNLPSPPPDSSSSLTKDKGPPVPEKPKSPSVGRGQKGVTSPTSQTLSSPIPQTSEASRVLGDFFTSMPKFPPRSEVDVQNVLVAKPDEDTKIRTLRKQIWELSGDGKQLPLPAHQEHILFEDSMYICTHVFGAADGARMTEVYFWTGDNVSESAAADAQLFAKKIARDNSGKLIPFKQGRETSKFFQALGGIVITRRGNSSRANQQNSFILCGRRHLGQIAFDEVDFTPQSFSSAFPYIVSSPTGKIFLWKGAGSGVDEVGSARLIGMDVGLTGEIEEIDEGREPSSFFGIFGSTAKNASPESSGHWKLKPKYDDFGVRLFRVDSRARSKVQEIFPFSQSDLAPSQVYFVDTFFETYILLGPQCKSKPADFQTAISFAQEYGILASSMEDRPFVPSGTVVVEGVPRDLKAVFRKWVDGRLGRNGSLSLRTVPLAAAIEATKR